MLKSFTVVYSCKFLVEALLTKEELQLNVDSIKPAIKAVILTAHGMSE
jgi:hypothetical protein